MAITETRDLSQFDDSTAELIGILRRHNRRHRDLVEILKRKKRAMCELDHETLAGIHDLEREAIAAIALVDHDRIEATRELAAALGKQEGDTMRLAEIALHVDGDTRDEILELREEIRELADELDQLNRLHRTLTVEFLGHLRLAVATLSGAGAVAAVTRSDDPHHRQGAKRSS